MLDSSTGSTSTFFSGHSMLKHKARAAYLEDYHSFIQYHQEYSILPQIKTTSLEVCYLGPCEVGLQKVWGL